MPSERPYPGQLWKHDSTHVIVVAVHLNMVTYELFSGGQSITESLGSSKPLVVTGPGTPEISNRRVEVVFGC